MGLGVLVFLAGAMYEVACVGWVHASERGRALQAAGWSALAATCEVTGILGVVESWQMAACFISGFATGTFLAVKVKGRR